MQSFKYAQQNGYKGSYISYIKYQHSMYVCNCQRCGIIPSTFMEWFNQ